MLVKIIGYIFIILGLFFLIKPAVLKRRLQKKVVKRSRKILFLILLFLGGLFLTAAFKSTGILSKLLIILGIIALIKGLFFLSAKASEKIIGWFSTQPLIIFRFLAITYIILGIIMLSS